MWERGHAGRAICDGCLQWPPRVRHAPYVGQPWLLPTRRLHANNALSFHLELATIQDLCTRASTQRGSTYLAPYITDQRAENFYTLPYQWKLGGLLEVNHLRCRSRIMNSCRRLDTVKWTAV